MGKRKFLDHFTKLQKDVEKSSSINVFAVEVAGEMVAKSHKDEAVKVLESALKNTDNDYLSYFINFRLSVLYEDRGEIQKALSSLESLVSSGLKFFEHKTYLDLGRLYLRNGDIDKSKRSFNHILKNKDKSNTDLDLIRLANLYLARLNEQK